MKFTLVEKLLTDTEIGISSEVLDKYNDTTTTDEDRVNILRDIMDKMGGADKYRDFYPILKSSVDKWGLSTQNNPMYSFLYSVVDAGMTPQHLEIIMKFINSGVMPKQRLAEVSK